MANLRGNSLVGGKPIVTIDMLNKFVEDIQAAQKDEMMHKYEREVITSNQIINAYIRDKSKNGVWLCSNVQDFSMYNYGTLLNFSTGSSRLQLYAPHKKASSDKYHDNAGLFFRTGWDNDIKDWEQVASVNYTNDKDNEIKEEINNSLKTEQLLSYTGSNIKATNIFNGRTENMIIKGRTLYNIANANNYEFCTSLPRENYDLSQGKNFCKLKINKYVSNCYYYVSAGKVNFDLLKPNTIYTLIAEATDGIIPTILTGGYQYSLCKNSTPFKNGIATITTNDLSNGNHEQLWYMQLNSTATYDQKIKNLMVFEGDLTENPANDYFEGINSFGDKRNDNKYEINLLSRTKNLCKFIEQGGTNGNKEFFGIDYNDNRYLRSNYINVKGLKKISYYLENHKDVLRFNVWCFYDENKKGIYPYGYGKTISVPPEAKYVRCEFSSFNEKDISQYYTSIRFSVNEGEPIEIFTPYKECEKRIIINEPLRSVDDIADEIIEINKMHYIKRFIKKVNYLELGGCYLYNKNEYFNRNEYCVRFDYVLKKLKNSDASKAVVSFKKYNPSLVDMNNNGGSFINVYQDGTTVGRHIYVCGPLSEIGATKTESELDIINKIKKYFEKNPFDVYYTIEEPEIECLDGTVDINLDTFNDTTHINIENNLWGVLDFKIPTNIYSLINNNSDNINKLYNKIEKGYFVKTIMLTEWNQINDSFKYSIKHNLGTRLIANVAATKVDGMSTNIDYKIVDENTIEVYVIDKAQLDIIIKTI